MRQDSGRIVHASPCDPVENTFTEIDDPNAAAFTQAWGINKADPIECPSVGTKAIAIEVCEIAVKPGKMLSHGDIKVGAKHAPAQNKPPKGAAPL